MFEWDVLVFVHRREVDILEDSLVGRFEDERWGDVGFECLDPPRETETPSVTGFETRKPELGTRRHEVVAPLVAKRKKLFSHHGAHLVSATIFPEMSTAPIPEIAGHRLLATGLEFGSENVLFGHTCRSRRNIKTVSPGYRPPPFNSFDRLRRGMETVIPPKKRRCERCGRVDTWKSDVETWVASGDRRGRPHCLHEWDINGAYNPTTGEINAAKTGTEQE